MVESSVLELFPDTRAEARGPGMSSTTILASMRLLTFPPEELSWAVATAMMSQAVSVLRTK
jgi:hypothetical protein